MNVLPGTDLPIHWIAILHGLVAAAVTVHVLLNKRDVRAAIGWIGLAWLSPFLGSSLYWLLGINRVARRASLLNRGDDQPQDSGSSDFTVAAGIPVQLSFVAMVGQRVTGRPLRGGNAVSLLRGGDEAYPAMLAAIRSARKSIALASYIFRADHIGCSFTDALAKAREQGVHVRVLIDGIGGGYIYSATTRALRARGISCARFLHDWVPWRMPLINMRNHKKLLIIDGAIGFTGGLNIGAENVLALHSATPVEDVHFRVEGPVIEQLMAAFSQDWEFTTREILDGEIWYPTNATAGTAFARGISEGPDQDLDKLETIILTALGEARSQVRVVTPYFLPDQRLLSALRLASLRGVEVDIVLPEHSNKAAVDWAAHAHLSDLMDAGVRVRLTPAPFDHAKLMTIDGLWGLIGSANWDERSLRLTSSSIWKSMIRRPPARLIV